MRKTTVGPLPPPLPPAGRRLNVENITGDRSLVPRGAAAHAHNKATGSESQAESVAVGNFGRSQSRYSSPTPSSMYWRQHGLRVCQVDFC